MNAIKYKLPALFEEKSRLEMEVSTVRSRGKTERRLEDLKDLVMEKPIAAAPTDTSLELSVECLAVLDIIFQTIYKERITRIGNAAGSSRIFLVGIVTRLAA